MQELKELIISKIIEKKELANLNKSFINKELALYILQNKKFYSKLKFKFESETHKTEKTKEFKKIVKEVRTKLRELFGVFYERDFQNAEKLVNSITKENAEEICFKILKLHKSSNERLRYYEEIYDKIFEIIKFKPKVILDIAAGYNAFSYFFMQESFNCSPEYHCCDIGDKDIELINNFFKKAIIKGNSFYCDLTANREPVKSIKADLCFLFKALDSFECVSKNISEEILQDINTKYFIVSFPTKSIGGAKVINPSKRAWFYKLLEKLNYSYEEFSIHNEMFLVIEKK